MEVTREVLSQPKTVNLEDYLTSVLGNRADDLAERTRVGQTVVSVLEAGRNTPGFVYFKPVNPVQEEPDKTSALQKYMIYQKEDRLAPEDVTNIEDHDFPLGILEVTPKDIAKYSPTPSQT